MIKFLLRFLTIHIFFCLMSTQLSAQKAQENSYTLRRGKAVVQSYCLPCHSLSVIEDLYLKPSEWKLVIDDMIELGMIIPTDKRQIIYDYLVMNFSLSKPKPKQSEQQEPKSFDQTKPKQSKLDKEITIQQKPKGLIKKGKQIFWDFGCDNCHKLGGQDAQGSDGPELDNLGSLLSLEMIKNTLRNPRTFYTEGYKQDYEDNVMPVYDLTKEELEALASYLFSQKIKS